MVRKFKTEQSSGCTILLVDDDTEYLEATRRLLEREGHAVLCVTNGAEALASLRQQHVDLLLLDYFMPGMTGEQVVTALREFNPYVQVILQTGYASEQPPRELLQRLDIQGYYDKSEGPDKLLLWTDVGLKAAYTVQLLCKSRQGLRYILDVTPEMHRIQPLQDLLQGVLWQVAGLLGAANSFLAVLPEGGFLRSAPPETTGFLAMLEGDTELTIRASTGYFVGHVKIDGCLEEAKVQLIREALRLGELRIINGSTIVPLRVGSLTIGIIYLDRPTVLDKDLELVQIFANQAAVAIQNMQLYEMAALDPLTGLYARGFFERWMRRELRTAFRSQQPIALLMLDLDDLKCVNDTAGHLVGDQALATLGSALRAATRSVDVVGRFGGDEFILILPQTPLEGAQHVCQRIFELLKDKCVVVPNGLLPLQCSVGVSALKPHAFSSADLPRPIPPTYFQTIAEKLIQSADAAMYQAKKDGGNRVCQGEAIEWQPVLPSVAS
jgi:diguanylate cyclase (GGDEF)-like protein